MSQGAMRDSKLWVGAHIAASLWVLAIAFFPQTHHMGVFLLFGMVLLPLLFIMSIRRVRADGTGDLSLGELHDQVKKGRRLPRSGVEDLTLVAMLVAAVKSMMN